jgi:predicted ester cyclase
MMSVEELNKAIVWEMLAAARRDGFTAQAEFFAEYGINHGMMVTREDIRAILRDIETTFPDGKLEPTTVVAEGDWVVARCYLSGTHTGTGRHPFVHEGLLANVPPTGKSMRVQHIHMFRLQDGQVVEHWASRDDIDMARQLGVIPSLAPTSAD